MLASLSETCRVSPRRRHSFPHAAARVCTAPGLLSPPLCRGWTLLLPARWRLLAEVASAHCPPQSCRGSWLASFPAWALASPWRSGRVSRCAASPARLPPQSPSAALPERLPPLPCVSLSPLPPRLRRAQCGARVAFSPSSMCADCAGLRAAPVPLQLTCPASNLAPGSRAARRRLGHVSLGPFLRQTEQDSCHRLGVSQEVGAAAEATCSP